MSTKLKAKKTFILGLTGGIAAGKSTVTDILRHRNIPVICADHWAHSVTEIGKPVYKKIIKTFGKDILKNSGEIDRALLGEKIFAKTKARKILEALVHPEVKKQMMAEARVFKKAGECLIVFDVPLLFEAGWQNDCDAVICVYATNAQLIERMQTRNGIPAHQARLRLKAQMPMREKCKKSDYVLKNTQDKIFLKKQVDELLQKLKNQANS